MRSYSDLENICLQLRNIFERELRSPDGDKNRLFLPGGRALDLLRGEEVAQLVRELYKAYRAHYNEKENAQRRKKWPKRLHGKIQKKWQRLRRCCARSSSDVTLIESSAEIFYRNLLGKDVENPEDEDTRALLLAILVLSGVSPTSPAWKRFVGHMFKPPTDERFSDRILKSRLERPALEDLFGDEDEDLINKIYFRQFVVCPYVFSGDGGTAQKHTILPILEEQAMKPDEETPRLYRTKVDTKSCRNSMPSDWMACKRIADREKAEVATAQRLKQQMVKQHEHICKTYDFVRMEESDETYIFMKLAKGSLLDFMRMNQWDSIGRDNAITWCEKMLGPAHALQYLHDDVVNPCTKSSLPIIHGDVKSSNIVLVPRGTEDDWRDCSFQLSDFGNASVESASAPPERISIAQLDNCPPERLDNLVKQQKTRKDDVRSYGCTVLEFLVWLEGGMTGKRAQPRDGAAEETLLATGLTAFQERRENVPAVPFGDGTNRRFFVVDVDDGCDFVERVFRVQKRTESGNQSLVIRLNPEIRRYFQQIHAVPDRFQTERNFFWDAFEIVERLALVPDPLERGTMKMLCDALEELISRYQEI